MHWDMIIAVFGVIITNLGTVIALYINLDKKLDENRKETNEILNGIRQEIKDFHKKLLEIYAR